MNSEFLSKNKISNYSRPQVVYTAGVFDLFHIGHLKLIRAAKNIGDKLIVAVSTDELIQEYKSVNLIVPFSERIEIVSAISYVDICIPQTNRCKFQAWERLHFDIWVVGDDWYGNDYYMEMRERLEKVGVRTVFFPHTPYVTSTIRRNQLVHHI